MIPRDPLQPQLLRAMQAGQGCKPWGARGAWLATFPELLLAWPGICGLLLPSHGAGWLQDDAEPTRGSCPALRGGAPGSCVPGDTWKADSARHLWDVPRSHVTAVLVPLQLSPGRNIPVPSCCSLAVCCTSQPVVCPGRKFCRREIIVLNLFCPQTTVKSLSCRQEGTSSPSPSSSPSKLTFFCCLNTNGERSRLVRDTGPGRGDGAPRK